MTLIIYGGVREWMGIKFIDLADLTFNIGLNLVFDDVLAGSESSKFSKRG